MRSLTSTSFGFIFVLLLDIPLYFPSLWTADTENMNSTVDYDTLKRLVFDVTGFKAKSIDQISRDEIRRNLEIVLENDLVIVCSLFGSQIPPYIIMSEVATMHYIRDYTSIPVPRVLAYEVDSAHPLGCFLLTEKALGVSLDIILPSLSLGDQDRVVAQIATWSAKLSRHRFGAIGSLYANSEDGYLVGPIVATQFFAEGRSHLRLDRGPYATAKNYLLACTQREIDCARTLVTQDASLSYQRDLENCKLQVDQSMLLLSDLVQRCRGLDDDDPELAPFSFDFHDMGPRNFIISRNDPTRIISVVGWDCIQIKPLWQCGRIPRWLQTSMYDGDNNTKIRLSTIFRHAMINELGRDSPLIRALDEESVSRCSLHDLCDYDAFKDGFLLRPTLESIAATLPGEEDMEGLQAILDPSTVTGRVARISLMTTGPTSDALTLAFSEMNMSDAKFHERKEPSLGAASMEATAVSR
ncbi:hypothetical protein DFH11DRAFT_1570878 [Phellopilus nigrolimitatus]|nr:hypothetical protein DFH11DRAFT_1570878 [Phellopilus nigrolimitatus]